MSQIHAVTLVSSEHNVTVPGNNPSGVTTALTFTLPALPSNAVPDPTTGDLVAQWKFDWLKGVLHTPGKDSSAVFATMLANAYISGQANTQYWTSDTYQENTLVARDIDVPFSHSPSTTGLTLQQSKDVVTTLIQAAIAGTGTLAWQSQWIAQLYSANCLLYAGYMGIYCYVANAAAVVPQRGDLYLDLCTRSDGGSFRSVLVAQSILRNPGAAIVYAVDRWLAFYWDTFVDGTGATKYALKCQESRNATDWSKSLVRTVAIGNAAGGNVTATADRAGHVLLNSTLLSYDRGLTWVSRPAFTVSNGLLGNEEGIFWNAAFATGQYNVAQDPILNTRVTRDGGRKLSANL
jgi:hypothetical protein